MATFIALFFLLIASVSGSPDMPDTDPLLEYGTPQDSSVVGGRDHMFDQLLKSSDHFGDSVEADEMLPVDSFDQSLTNDFEVRTEGSSGGAIYTRWGSSSCAYGSELIYSGTTAGSHFRGSGGGANYLCMPSEPIYDRVETYPHDDRAHLFSSEYQTNTGPTALRSVHDNTPTCAVCRAPSNRTTKLMVPGRNRCPSASWRLEYKGYLMAERHNHHRSDFICMDRDMDPEPGTEGNQDGALLYFVESRCLVGGGLPCGPYVHGYELTCAICTI